MPIYRTDGRFALALWENPDSEGEENDCEYVDTEKELDELRSGASRLVNRSRYRHAILYRWEGDWIFMEEFERDV